MQRGQFFRAMQAYGKTHTCRMVLSTSAGTPLLGLGTSTEGRSVISSDIDISVEISRRNLLLTSLQVILTTSKQRAETWSANLTVLLKGPIAYIPPVQVFPRRTRNDGHTSIRQCHLVVNISILRSKEGLEYPRKTSILTCLPTMRPSIMTRISGHNDEWRRSLDRA